METIHRDYQSKGVNIFFVYKALAHPEGGSNNYIQPFTLKERLMHIAEAKKTLGATIPWICDTMENDLKHALGDRPNSEFVIDPKGKIVRIRGWSSPVDLRADLETLVGKVDNPTRVSDLNLKIETTPKPAAQGIVPRPSIPRGLTAVQAIPQEGKHPFYVKLRVEVDQNVLNGRSGQAYLGFHLDPIYHVHWNNLAKPLSYSVRLPEGASAKPAQGTGPKVEAESDIDPREFVIELDPGRTNEFEVEVKYFACNDEAGFCIPVTQVYKVSLTRDRDAGNPRRSTGGRRPSGQQTRNPQRGNPQGQRPANNTVPRGFTARRLFTRDLNEDGKISRSELPGSLSRMVDRLDTNKDGFIDRKEAEDAEKRSQNK